MSWTTAADLRVQVQKLWDRGVLPTALVSGTPLFPRRLALKVPTSDELSQRFDEAREWAGALRRIAHCRVVMREVRHRVIGSNSVPCEVWVDSLADALAMIGLSKDAHTLEELSKATRSRNALLLPWVEKYALRAMALADDWTRMLDVIAWMQLHPRPGIYLRQIDLPHIHTKFIEGHRGVLLELLDLALPPEAIDRRRGGISQFCARYGFRDKPQRIRFRMLDASRALLPIGTDQDLTLNTDAFDRLESAVKRVFITENETNYLAFPEVADAMVVFGAGYGFEMLANAAWLHQCEIYYWGDIDTHGFAILDQLRARIPDAQSLLMDRETLMSHLSAWTQEPTPERRDLARLTSAERALYDDLRDNRLGASVRLEQERIAFGWLNSALSHLRER
jgi:hypothetical protein